MGRNQSGSEKDNRLFFREQSKSQMALFHFSQSEAELKIQNNGNNNMKARACWKTAH